jgi:hypothetical protein
MRGGREREMIWFRKHTITANTAIQINPLSEIIFIDDMVELFVERRERTVKIKFS